MMGEVCLSERKHDGVHLLLYFVEQLNTLPIVHGIYNTRKDIVRQMIVEERDETLRDGLSMCTKCGSYILIHFLSMHNSLHAFLFATTVEKKNPLKTQSNLCVYVFASA